MSRKANSRGLCFRAELKLSGRERFYFCWSVCHGDDASIGCFTMFCQPLLTGRCSQRGAPICASCKDLSQLSTFKLSFSTSSSLSLLLSLFLILSPLLVFVFLFAAVDPSCVCCTLPAAALPLWVSAGSLSPALLAARGTLCWGQAMPGPVPVCSECCVGATKWPKMAQLWSHQR